MTALAAREGRAWSIARSRARISRSCGTSGIQTGVLEAHFALEQGRFLKDVCLAGDFIANSPAIASLEYRLRLCPAERGAIARVVDAVFGDPAHYMLGVGPLRAVADTIIKGLPVLTIRCCSRSSRRGSLRRCRVRESAGDGGPLDADAMAAVVACLAAPDKAVQRRAADVLQHVAPTARTAVDRPAAASPSRL